MVFRVELSPQAFEDLDSIAEYIRKRGSFESAERWFTGIMDAIRGLEELPARCPRAVEPEELEFDIRVLFYGKRNRRYKVYFAIHEQTKTVRVFHVRHWARKPTHANDLNALRE
jgi:plasmid stabilization system protein ParE